MKAISLISIIDGSLNEETFTPPGPVQNQAKKALKYRDDYPDEINGGTRVGWTRANQLANGEAVSFETVKRMAAFFSRHEGNKSVSAENKNTPWKDAGYVAWLLWGGDAGRTWAESVIIKYEGNK